MGFDKWVEWDMCGNLNDLFESYDPVCYADFFYYHLLCITIDKIRNRVIGGVREDKIRNVGISEVVLCNNTQVKAQK